MGKQTITLSGQIGRSKQRLSQRFYQFFWSVNGYFCVGKILFISGNYNIYIICHSRLILNSIFEITESRVQCLYNYHLRHINNVNYFY